MDHPTSLDPCSASMARQRCHQVYFSPTTITLAAEENWPTLTIAAVTPRPSHRTIPAAPDTSPAPRPSCKVTLAVVVTAPTSAIWPPCKTTISTILAVIPASRPSRMNISSPVVATTAPQYLYEAPSTAVVATLTPASRPLQKVIITAVISASRSAHKTSSMVSLCSSRTARAQYGLRKAKRMIRKIGPVSRRTTHLNCQDT
ncbi:hypothetical protein ACLOJK_026896 [Asimina triloba]